MFTFGVKSCGLGESIESGEELGHVFVTFDAVEASFGIEESGDAPPLAHVAVAPAFDATGDALGHAEGAFDGVRGGERLAK